MNEDDRKRLGELIETRRKLEYGTKSAAYQLAGVNAATWDRAEAGLPIREDRMTAVLRTLFGIGTTPEVVLGSAGNSYSGIHVPFGPNLDEPDSNTADLASWTADNFIRINDALADLAETVEEIKRKVGGDDGTQASTQKSELDKARERREAELSESAETMDPAALDAEPDVDEEPGGSDHDEG